MPQDSIAKAWRHSKRVSPHQLGTPELDKEVPDITARSPQIFDTLIRQIVKQAKNTKDGV